MIDPVWEVKYQQGFDQRYPWDAVVSFVYRYAPKNKKKEAVDVLEVGFGSGSNLWFAAREGYSVHGIEASLTAVEMAKKRFQQEGLSGNLQQGDFVLLPFEDDSMDMAIDRAALTHVAKNDHKRAINEIHRVLKKGSFFHYNAYADSHSSSLSGQRISEGTRQNITEGSLTGVGQVYFPSRDDIEDFFSTGWILHQVQRRESMDMLNTRREIHADWLVIAEKTT